jgi:hypothetical protein
MKLLTYLELSRYSKAQLWDLHRQMLLALPAIPQACEDRRIVHLNIQHIRLFLARRDYTPC